MIFKFIYFIFKKILLIHSSIIKLLINVLIVEFKFVMTINFSSIGKNERSLSTYLIVYSSVERKIGRQPHAKLGICIKIFTVLVEYEYFEYFVQL